MRLRAVRSTAAALALVLTTRAQPARAQTVPSPSVPTRPATFSWDEQTLRATFSYRDVIDEAMQLKLKSGLPTRLDMRAYLFRDKGGAWIAATFRSCKVVYDVWDEVYRITVTQAGEPDRVDAALNVEGVLRRCAEARELAVGTRSALQPTAAYYVGVIVEVNPVSPEMVERIRRWVSRTSSTAGGAPGDALFGSFVGLFVNRVGVADRQLLFRTPLFRS